MTSVAVLVFCGYKFSVGAKKDVTTGLSFTYHGFRVGDVFLTDSGSRKCKTSAGARRKRKAV